MTYGKEGQVSVGSSRSRMYTYRWMDLWNNGFRNLRSRTGQLLPKIEVISYTRKRQAKQPCLDTKRATESDGCSSSLRMDGIHVGPGDQSDCTA